MSVVLKGVFSLCYVEETYIESKGLAVTKLIFFFFFFFLQDVQ